MLEISNFDRHEQNHFVFISHTLKSFNSSRETNQAVPDIHYLPSLILHSKPELRWYHTVDHTMKNRYQVFPISVTQQILVQVYQTSPK